MRKIFLLLIIVWNSNCFSQGIQSEKYFLFENMCDNIVDSIYQTYKSQSQKFRDSLIHGIIVECTKEYVTEISKSRFTYPYRRVNKNYFPLPSKTELLFANKHYQITDENINTGFAEQYPYDIYDSIMYDFIINKYGDDIFIKIKKSCDSLNGKGKGYIAATTRGSKKQHFLLKEIINGKGLDTIKCNRGNIFTMSIDSSGQCTNIELRSLGWHGTTMLSDCVELINRFAPIHDKLLKIRWKPAEFEGQPMKSEVIFNFYEFKY